MAGPAGPGNIQASPVVPSGGMSGGINVGFPPGTNPQAQVFPHQMSPSAPYPNGVAPNSMQPPASTSRPGSSHHALAHQNLRNLTPQQQQQLILIQQQQRMGGMGTPQRTNPGFQYQQQSPQHHSPQMFPDGSGEQQANPVLSIPGSSVPGIAKSSRSPSVPTSSPVKGQGSFGPDGFSQTQSMAITSGQHLPLQPTQMSQMALQQGQVNNQHVSNQPWPPNMNNAGMGMNPSAFQLNTVNPIGQQQPGGAPMYMNPSAVGQQGMNTGQGPGWSPQPIPNAGSPTPSAHDLVSQRASATPAPNQGQMGSSTQFDRSNAYPPQWTS